MVFQDYALWPHMTIGRNVAFPLEMRGVARPERERRVTEALARVGLAGFEGRAPSQLSGGQQQRAAVARALVAEPNLILFDEPLSNLDRALRETLSQDLSSLLRASALTAVYVTHDHEEAFTLADRVILMRKGAIVQDASPGLVTREPADPDAARFLRLGAVLHAERRGGAWTAPGFPHPIKPTRDMNGARSAHVLIPNGAAALTSPSRHVGLASVIRSSYGPEGFIATIRLDGADADMTIRAGGSGRPAPGERVGVAIDESALHWFEPARTRGAEGEARAD
jgi:iron(III) transport system ATP-binding protein